MTLIPEAVYTYIPKFYYVTFHMQSMLEGVALINCLSHWYTKWSANVPICMVLCLENACILGVCLYVQVVTVLHTCVCV